MDPQSPPKRMTRARAAAKASSEAAPTTVSTTSRAKSAATASKAKSARSTSTVRSTATTASAAAKRKLRSEDIEIDTDNEEDELGLDQPDSSGQPKVTRPARGRPKKAPTAAESEPGPKPEAPLPRAPRGRPPSKKTSAAESSAQDLTRPSSRASGSTPIAAATTARTSRTKKTVAAADEDDTTTAGEASNAPVKKRTTRTRATSTSTGAASSTATKISVRTASTTAATKPAAAKKKVSFEEPEKENIAPKAATAKGKVVATKAAEVEATSTGLRAKPVRRAAATPSTGTASKATASAARSKATSTGKASGSSGAPLSPKKVTQVRMVRDLDVDSEDELGAMDTNPIKPLMRSPTKPAMNTSVTASERTKKLANAGLDLESATRDAGSGSDKTNSTLPPPELPVGMLASPARRMPPTPFKEGLMNTPARRLDGLAPHNSVPASTSKPAEGNNVSLLLSPAKRFPVQGTNQTGSSLDDTTRSPFKMSLLQTPAKRPTSPVKAAILLQRPDVKPLSLSAKAEVVAMSPEPKSTLLATPRPVPATIEEDEEQVSDDETANNDESTALTQMLKEMDSEAAEVSSESPVRRRFPGRLSSVLPRDTDPTLLADSDETQVGEGIHEQTIAVVNTTIAAYKMVLPPGEPMDIDETVTGVAAPLPASSPNKQQTVVPSGIFGLRAKDLIYHDVDSESEDELTTRLPLSVNDAPSTPCPVDANRGAKTPSSRVTRQSMAAQSTAKRLRTGKFGFTPLAEQLDSWMAHSPTKTKSAPLAAGEQKTDIGEEAITDEGFRAEVIELNNVEDVQEPSPTTTDPTVLPTFFEDAMAGHSVPSSPLKTSKGNENPNENNTNGATSEPLIGDGVQMPVFDDVDVTQEDLELAQEANDMSLMEPQQIQDMINLTASPDDSVSEASEDYGDENAIPIDPALLAPNASSPAVPPVTPQRVMTREFHTVSKVPLKPADESTPRPAMRRRSLSLSRLPTASRRRSGMTTTDNTTDNSQNNNSGSRSDRRPGLVRNGTVISYSPTKKESRRESRRKSRRESFGGAEAAMEMANSDEDHKEEQSQGSAPVTPAKSQSAWSTAGTPARTPRRDLDPALLRGAVVFVDVHTTEGADASGIFVELLSQMGARCVKSWPWNPCSPPSARESSSATASSKVGITHVVFKDGSKRTLEKVRESNGVVQCVGVSWVLDCERENQWLDEAPYYIDTSLVPRGGARRRKSMEPRAIANMNGMIVSTPAKQTYTASSARDCHTAPATPVNRRDSALWVRTPDDESDTEDHGYGGEQDADGEPDWNMAGLLTPVPKTPAPEAIARFAASITPSTPLGNGTAYGYGDDDDTLSSVPYGQNMLITRTCPPKNTYYQELGEGILSREKDEGVLMRLMAARRKSLQFAPKVASPLSKTWD